jgi:hypothetical protein
MSEQRKDIVQEFVDLYKREEMLAFFDFTLRHGSSLVSGLCRISRPKSGSSGMSYVSLTFMADAEDPGARTALRQAMMRLESEQLKEPLPTVSEVLIVPIMEAGSATCVAQVDLLLEGSIEVDREFLSDGLLPALRSATSLEFGELVWWGQEGSAEAATLPESSASLIERLKKSLLTR